LPGEIWRPYKNSFVSSEGRFKNCRGVMTTPSPQASGYVYVMIEHKNVQIHRIIATVFELERNAEQDQVDHIDGNPSNNRLSNLRWVTRRENVQLSFKNNLNRKSSAPQQSKPLLGRKVGDEQWLHFDNSRHAAKELGLPDHGAIRHVARDFAQSGAIHTTYGYEFRYEEASEPEVLPGEIWRDVVTEYQA
jgi:hypothetical protein